MKFLISLFLVFSLYGKVLDTTLIIVNNIPITSYDIFKIQKKLDGDKNKAINYLIDQTVLKSAIKQKGIYVDEFDIDNTMKKIAQRNGMSLFNFKNYLLEKGELSKLKSQIKDKLEMDKLFQSLNIRVTQSEMKTYYKLNKKEFNLPSKIEVSQYSSNTKNELIKILKNPMLQNKNVSIKSMVLESNKTNPKLIKFIANTKVDNFTPIINLENKFVSFYLIKKDDFNTLPFKMVESEIYQKLMSEKQKMATKDFVAKLRAKANIQVLTK